MVTTLSARRGFNCLTWLRNESGSTLVMTMAIVTSSLLVGTALFTLGRGEADLVEYAVDSARAFSLAEAGQERARTWLEELAGKTPPVFPDQEAVTDEPLGSGSYSYSVKHRGGAYPWPAEYEVVSSGSVDGVTEGVRSILRHETFAQYLYYSDQSARVWFTTGDTLDGRVHINGYVLIAGDPWFGMKVTSTKDAMVVTRGSHPTFAGGYELGVEEVAFPAPAGIRQSLGRLAEQGGTFGPPLNGSRAYYEVVLGRGGRLGYMSYRSYEKQGGRYRFSRWTDVELDDINGVAWFDAPVRLSGTLDGQLTIGSAKDIHIRDDVLYADSEEGHGPSPSCDDLLGLVAGKNIIVDATDANMDDCEIHAHMIALDKSLTAEKYWAGKPRGDLIIYGGFAQKKIGPVGKFNKYGVIHGYNKDYHFDNRLAANSPPGYPTTDRYVLVSWERTGSPGL